ncbi:hypothetical protein PUNSTDRAFT_47398 [Punctularia strigosozonata HHB-11173 SS5]|uniref:RNI-like protein n=1 Tax=Punctularia strigosozonata (strain HHB-11173) TaxID=741275 RepID=R7S4Q0_PUNST|nr:uncharacterized protein PUNSTDRAFT_47398 [Punctularia strigosozonata HHB-11173 SS5]EIN04777.1 hypothetical protein PUNSTDRAFT_47398 [Punctularia strigosozonata HHB-11173 SS5]
MTQLAGQSNQLNSMEQIDTLPAHLLIGPCYPGLSELASEYASTPATPEVPAPSKNNDGTVDWIAHQPSDTLRLETCAECEQLLATLSTTPHLGDSIKTLDVDGRSRIGSPNGLWTTLPSIFTACRGLQTLRLRNFKSLPGLPTSGALNYLIGAGPLHGLHDLILQNCVMDSYDDLAEALGSMPLLRNLRLDHVSSHVYQQPWDRGRWPYAGLRLRALDLKDHVITETHAGPIAEGISRLEMLDMTIKNWQDHDLLQCLTVPRKGLEHLTLSVNWEGKPDSEDKEDKEWPEETIYSGECEWTRGVALRTLTLREYARERPRENAGVDGEWASRFLRTVNCAALESVILVIHYVDPDPWHGLRWADADDVLAACTTLCAVVVKHEDLGDPRCDTANLDLKAIMAVVLARRLPKVAERGILQVIP